MPRGVYDRSKIKRRNNVNTVENAATEPRVKRKYTRRSTSGSPGFAVQALPADLLAQLRELVSIRSAGGLNYLDGLIQKVAGKLEEAWDKANTTVEDKTAEAKSERKKRNGKVEGTEQVVQTAIPAPVPFIPQTAVSQS
jgi:hypothetical protein